MDALGVPNVEDTFLVQCYSYSGRFYFVSTYSLLRENCNLQYYCGTAVPRQFGDIANILL